MELKFVLIINHSVLMPVYAQCGADDKKRIKLNYTSCLTNFIQKRICIPMPYLCRKPITSVFLGHFPM